MGDLDEYIEQHNKENSEQNSEIEKSLYRYIIIGSSASIIFILTFYKDAIREEYFSDFLDFELVLFTISLFLGIIGLFLNMLFGERMSKHLTESLRIALEKQSLGKITEANAAEARDILIKSKSNISSLNSQMKLNGIIRNIFLICGGLIFSIAIISSIYSVVKL